MRIHHFLHTRISEPLEKWPNGLDIDLPYFDEDNGSMHLKKFDRPLQRLELESLNINLENTNAFFELIQDTVEWNGHDMNRRAFGFLLSSGAKGIIVVFGFTCRVRGMIDVVASCIIGIVRHLTDLLSVTDRKRVQLDTSVMLEIGIKKCEDVGITFETVNGMDANTTLLGFLKESECHKTDVRTDVEHLGIVRDVFEKSINDFLIPDTSDGNGMLKHVVIESNDFSSIHIVGTDNDIHYQEEGRLDLGRIG